MLQPPLRVESPRRPADDEPKTLEGIERAAIARVLGETNGVIGGPRGAAARLGLKRTTLQSMIKRLGLSLPREAAGPDIPWTTELSPAGTSA